MQSNRCFTCRSMILNQKQPGLKRKIAKIPQHQPVLFLHFWGHIAFPLKELEESEEVGGCCFVDLAVRQGSKCVQWWKADGQSRHGQTRRRQRLHLSFLGDWGLCRAVPPDLSGYLKRRDSRDPGACWWSRRRRKKKKKISRYFQLEKHFAAGDKKKKKKKLSEKCF